MPVRTPNASTNRPRRLTAIAYSWTASGPGGLSREQAAVDQWAPELAPSAQLRRWYGHEPSRFEEFARRYRGELGAQRERLNELRRALGRASSRWSSQRATPRTATRPCSGTSCAAACAEARERSRGRRGPSFTASASTRAPGETPEEATQTCGLPLHGSMIARNGSRNHGQRTSHRVQAVRRYGHWWNGDPIAGAIACNETGQRAPPMPPRARASSTRPSQR